MDEPSGFLQRFISSPWWQPLLWLVIAAAVAFAVGLFIKYRRAAIQREYQRHIEDAKKQSSQPPGPGR